MITKSTARLALSAAILGSVWAFFREYLRYRQEQTVNYLNFGLAIVIPVILYVVIRINRN